MGAGMTRGRAVLAALCMAAAGTGTGGAQQAVPAASAAPSPRPSIAKQRPLTDFAMLPTLDRPVLSPDGQAYAARMAVDGKQYLAIVPLLNDGKPRLIPTGDSELNWWRWVNKNWLVIGLGQVMNVVGTEMYVSRAIGISADAKRTQMLATRDAAQSADDVIWTASDGSARLLVAFQASLYADNAEFWPQVREYDLETGRYKLAQRPMTNVVSWFADGEGTVRLGVGMLDDGRTTRVYHRVGRNAPFRVIDRGRTGVDEVISPALFLPGNKALTVADDADGFSAVYDLDLGTLERGAQLHASKGFDIGGIVPDETGTKLLGVRLSEDREAVRWVDPVLAAIEKEVSASVKGARVRLVSYARDRSRAILLASNPDAPGAYVLWDKATGTVSPMAHVNDAIKMSRLHPVRTIRYKARDGLEIAAVLTVPRGRSSKLPLIVMPHGGPFSRDTEEWDWWTQFLADRGYAVVQPNYRGSSGYGTQFTRRGEGQWGLAMQDDLNDAVAALAEKGTIDPKRVCMMGASYGGYAAMRAAQRDGKLYRCAVSYAGVSDLPALRRYDSRFLMAGVRSDWMKRQAPDLGAVSPINGVDGFSIPLLLVHGAKDRVVPLRQSKSIAGKLRAAGKDVTFIEQREADHHFSRGEDRVQFLQALEAFLGKHNPA